MIYLGGILMKITVYGSVIGAPYHIGIARLSSGNHQATVE